MEIESEENTGVKSIPCRDNWVPVGVTIDFWRPRGHCALFVSTLHLSAGP